VISPLLIKIYPKNSHVEAEESELSDNERIEPALRDIGFVYIPKHAIFLKNYYMRQGLNIGLVTSVQQFVESLNDLNHYLLCFSEENPKKLDQDEIIEILDQAMASEWHEVMVSGNIDIFEMSYDESVSYFRLLENLKNHQQSRYSYTHSR
jgi:hypothetical protein